MRQRSGNAWWLVASALVFLIGSGRPAVADDARLKGRVLDRSGAGVGDATVVLTALRGGAPPGARAAVLGGPPAAGRIEVVRTSSAGEFVAALPRGRYRVAAFKPGYSVTMTEVNTSIRDLLELRLDEAAKTLFGDLPPEAAPPGRDLGWILRTAQSDILRDDKNALPAAVVPEERRSSSSLGGWLEAILQPVDGEIVQHFSSASPLADQGGAPGGLSGRSTSLALRGVIGGQGTWRFDGLMGRLSSGSAEGGGAARQGRSADRMQVGIDTRLGDQDRLKAELRYGTNRYVVDPSGETVNATDQDQTNLGLRSRWERTFGHGGLLHVEGSYAETRVRTPDGDASTFSSLAGIDPDLNRVGDQALLATAGLAFDAGDHRLDFGLRAKSYRYELRNRGILLYSLDDSPTLTEPGERGQDMSLYGSDDWRLTGRAILNYGLRYHTSLVERRAYLVPRLGVTFEPGHGGGTSFRSVVLFRLDEPGIASSQARRQDGQALRARDVDRLGYAFGIERHPEDRLQLTATYSYKPFEEGVGEDEAGIVAPGAWGDALIFLTDGAAGRHELGVRLERGFGGFTGSLTGSVGRVAGRLTPAIEEAPVQILSLGEVRYYLTRLRALYGRTDTEVEIDYRHVQAETGIDDAVEVPGSLDYRRLDLLVAQDLPRLGGALNAKLKILMAYQGLIYGAAYEGSGSIGAAPPMAAARLTGGIDIRF